MMKQYIGICLYCQKPLDKPRIEKGRVVQKYCNNTCKNSYHKKRRRDNEDMLREILEIIEKYRPNE
jgi:SET domain-containing protein